MTNAPLKILKECREQTLRLTQEDLGKALGVTGVTVSRWETGERKIARDLLPRVVEKTGIPARELRPDLALLLAETSGA